MAGNIGSPCTSTGGFGRNTLGVGGNCTRIPWFGCMCARASHQNVMGKQGGLATDSTTGAIRISMQLQGGPIMLMYHNLTFQ